MSADWEGAWDVINAEFSLLAEQVLDTHPSAWWSCGHAENDAFSFWAYASFGRSGVPGDEDVVVSLTFKDGPAGLVFSSDVALNDGQIVADGPSGMEPVGSDRGLWVKEQAAAGAVFVRSQVATLRGLL